MMMKMLLKTLLEQANVAFFRSILIDEELSTFETWNHEDSKVKGKWQDAIKNELDYMDKQQVWDIIKKEDIQENRGTIKCKWIFKIKRNGNFRAVKFLELTSMKALIWRLMMSDFESV
jgi:hypothetical protein